MLLTGIFGAVDSISHATQDEQAGNKYTLKGLLSSEFLSDLAILALRLAFSAVSVQELVHTFLIRCS